MSDLGDRLREFAMVCDAQPKIVAAGVIVRPNETVVAAFTETEHMDIQAVAIGLYNGVLTPSEPMIFRDAPQGQPH